MQPLLYFFAVMAAADDAPTIQVDSQPLVDGESPPIITMLTNLKALEKDLNGNLNQLSTEEKSLA